MLKLASGAASLAPPPKAEKEGAPSTGPGGKRFEFEALFFFQPFFLKIRPPSGMSTPPPSSSNTQQHRGGTKFQIGVSHGELDSFARRNGSQFENEAPPVACYSALGTMRVARQPNAARFFKKKEEQERLTSGVLGSIRRITHCSVRRPTTRHPNSDIAFTGRNEKSQ